MLMMFSCLHLKRAGLPKKGEIFFFFKIRDNRVQDFCTKLSDLIPLITTVAQCQDDQERIAREKRRASEKHKTPVVIEMSGINIAFSQKGLNKVNTSQQDRFIRKRSLIHKFSIIVEHYRPHRRQRVRGWHGCRRARTW